MSKYCGKCGNQLPDDARICGYCGCVIEQAPAPAPVEPFVDPQPAAPYQPVSTEQPATSVGALDSVKNTANGLIGKMKTDKKFMFMVIGIAAGTFTIIIALILALCLGKGYTKAINNQLDAMQGDYDAYLDCVPESYWDDEYIEFLDEDEFEEKYGQRFDLYYDVDIDFEILTETEIEGAEFTSLKENLVRNWGVSRKDIDSAYSLQVLFCSETDGVESYNVSRFIVVKIDGSWYTYNFGIFD